MMSESLYLTFWPILIGRRIPSLSQRFEFWKYVLKRANQVGKAFRVASGG